MSRKDTRKNQKKQDKASKKRLCALKYVLFDAN